MGTQASRLPSEQQAGRLRSHVPTLNPELGTLNSRADAAPAAAGLSAPILDQLRPSLDFARNLRRAHAPALDGVAPAWSGAFPQGAAPVEIRFKKPVRGRYFCIETLDAHDGGPHAAIAEIELFDAQGATHRIDGWVVIYADSEERLREDGAGDNALDGQSTSRWHTEYSENSPAHPHRLILDLRQTRAVSGFRYVPAQGPDAATTGRIKTARAYVGDHLVRPAR